MAEPVTYLFTDTGGILLLDPANAPALAPACVPALDTALDPDGRTDASSGRSAAEWSDEWSTAMTEQRERGAFEGEAPLSRHRACYWPVPNGTYAVHVEYAGDPPGERPIVGEYGSPTHSAIALSLLPVSAITARHVAGRPFPGLPSSLAGYPSHHAGWRSWALVETLSGPSAVLSLMLTDSVQSGQAHAAVPADLPLAVGDFVLVALLARTAPYWEARILRKAP